MPTPELPVGVSGAPGRLLTVARDQRVVFLAVGAVNSASGFFWFALFYWLVGQRYGYLTALALAHVYERVLRVLALSALGVPRSRAHLA